MIKEKVISSIADVVKDSTKTTKKTANTIMLLFAAVISAAAVGASIVVYRNGDAILKKIGEDHFIAKLDKNTFALEIPHLLRRSGGVSATIWAVDLASNTKVVLYSYDITAGEKGRAQYYGTHYPLYASDDKNSLNVVKMQKGDVVCDELRPESDIGNHSYLQNDARYYCSISVPPDAGQFIGMITVGFKTKKELSSVLVNYFRFASKKIVRY